MTRRLADMAEQAMLEGGQSARKSVEQAVFSEELKRELEERIAAGAFKSKHAAAQSLVNMPVGVVHSPCSSVSLIPVYLCVPSNCAYLSSQAPVRLRGTLPALLPGKAQSLCTTPRCACWLIPRNLRQERRTRSHSRAR